MRNGRYRVKHTFSCCQLLCTCAYFILQETYDQKVFCNTLLTFGQCPYIVTEQAAISGLNVGMLHGNIDLLAGTESPSATASPSGTASTSGTASSSYVLCMLASSKVYTPLTEPNGTTVKTPTTFDMLSFGKLLGMY